MRIEEIVLNEERNVRLSAWIQDVEGEYGEITKRPAMLVLPGGGYSMCSDREAEPVAAAYTKAGFQTFILRYSVGEHNTWPNPLNDYEQAITLIRKNTEKWHVDVNRVGVVGFSAGGHLAACAATVAENRPNAAILGYAALTKEICETCQSGMPYPVDCVDEKTPQCFLFAARDDSAVNVENTVKFQQSLINMGISFESHIYSFGGHGFSTAEAHVSQSFCCGRVKNWVDDSIEWLGEIWGVLTSKGFTQPVCRRLVNADCCDNLSLDCTIRHLKKQNEEVQMLLKDYYMTIDAVVGAKFQNIESAVQIVDGFRLSDVLEMLQTPGEVLMQLDKALGEITNDKREL